MSIPRGANCFPVDRAARDAWFESRVPEVPEHPKPETPWRPAEEHEIPRGARFVINAAIANGWDYYVTYARGTGMNAKGLPAYLIDSIQVGLRHGDTRAVAVWHNSSSICAYIWSSDKFPAALNVTALKKVIASST